MKDIELPPLPDGVVDSELVAHIRKHIDTYADKHPALLVRQLAGVLRTLLASTPAPAQQERKPMTDEVVRLAGVVLNEMPHPVTNWQSAAKKVCEAVAAIKEQT